jgi:WD40 repeat protein
VSARWSSDGKYLACGGADRAIHVWPVNPPGPPRVFTGHRTAAISVAWAPRGALLASGAVGDNMLRFWRMDDAPPPAPIRVPKEVTALAWSPDGKTLATAATWVDAALHLWDVETGAERRPIPQAGGVTALSWAPGGAVLASGGADRSVHLWAVATGRRLRYLEGSADQVEGVAWSADGRTVAKHRRALVELPQEADSGTSRVWIPFTRFRRQEGGG